MFGILFRVEAKPGKRQELVDFLKRDGEVARDQEPGTLRFEFYPDPREENALYVYEAYRNEEAFKDHQQNAPYKEWSSRVLAEQESFTVVFRGDSVWPPMPSYYKNRVKVPGEEILEIVIARDNAGFGLAVANIQRSRPHYHLNTRETYVLISGTLIVHLGDKEVMLERPGGSVEIPIGTMHWAESAHNASASIAVLTIPAWMPEDHILA